MTRPQETFTDMLARLFPMPGIQLGINSPHSKCITFQVTEDCNLRCSYCYQGCKTHRKMSLETAKAAVDMLLAADERTNQYITSTEVAGVVLDFIGGEPLLEVELIDQILDYFVAQTFRLHHPWATRWKASMSTNGTLHFRPEVQRFLDKWAKRLSLSISIDGDKQLMSWVGGGNTMDFEKITEAFVQSGTRLAYIEQDYCNGENPFVCLKKSYEYLKSIGLD